MKTLGLAVALIVTGMAALALPALAQPAKDCGAVPDEVAGPASVIDGDTIAIQGLKPHIRLWGVQAPELRDKGTNQETVPGMRARAALAELMTFGGGDVTCRPTKFDRYCRLVAICMAPRGDYHPEDIGWAMIDRGFAYGAWLEDVAPGQPALGRNYAWIEHQARKDRRGLWPAWLGEK